MGHEQGVTSRPDDMLSLGRRDDPWWRPPRVLIVDDQPTNVRMLELMLQSADVTDIASTTDPFEAQTLFSSFEPDLVLLDLRMPGLDGIAVMEELARLTPDDSFVPVVVLTADDSADAMERALAAGAKDFLTKPFNFTEVVLRIRNLLETRSLHLRLHSQKAALEDQIRRQAEEEARAAESRRLVAERIQRVLRGAGMAMLFQPISDLSSGHIEGVEALARFSGEPRRTPDRWFKEAAEIGLGTQLEVLAVAMAVAAADLVPAGAYLAVNVSPTTITSPALLGVLDNTTVGRLVLEVTEHAEVDDYGALCASLEELRDHGWRIAVDDAGAGYASLRHILRLRPEIIKLDTALTQGVDVDPVRRVLASSMISFAAEMNATVTAEGVENRGERDALRDLGVPYGQGYYLARPAPLPLTEGPAPG